jgi:hypothetical protein
MNSICNSKAISLALSRKTGKQKTSQKLDNGPRQRGTKVVAFPYCLRNARIANFFWILSGVGDF